MPQSRYLHQLSSATWPLYMITKLLHNHNWMNWVNWMSWMNWVNWINRMSWMSFENCHSTWLENCYTTTIEWIGWIGWIEWIGWVEWSGWVGWVLKIVFQYYYKTLTQPQLDELGELNECTQSEPTIGIWGWVMKLIWRKSVFTTEDLDELNDEINLAKIYIHYWRLGWIEWWN